MLFATNMNLRATLFLCAMLMASCGGSSSQGRDLAGSADAGGDLDARGDTEDVTAETHDATIKENEAGSDARDDEATPTVTVCTGAAGFNCVSQCANDVIRSPLCIDGQWTCPQGTFSTSGCSCVGQACLAPPPPFDAGTGS